MNLIRTFAMCGLTATSVALSAQDRTDATRQVDALVTCRAVAAPDARLACYDRAAAAIVTARSSGDLLVLDRKEVVERKRARFGLPTPTADMFGGGAADKATEVKELSSTVTHVTAGRPGRWNLELANGSSWQTVDTTDFPPQAGATIVIREAALGGYRAKLAGRRSMLVKRLR